MRFTAFAVYGGASTGAATGAVVVGNIRKPGGSASSRVAKQTKQHLEQYPYVVQLGSALLKPVRLNVRASLLPFNRLVCICRIKQPMV